jgi:hypothetical protein
MCVIVACDAVCEGDYGTVMCMVMMVVMVMMTTDDVLFFFCQRRLCTIVQVVIS